MFRPRLLIFLISSVALNQQPAVAELSGSVRKDVSGANSTLSGKVDNGRVVLNGGVRDDAALKSSIILNRGNVASPGFNPSGPNSSSFDLNVTQFKGSARSGDGAGLLQAIPAGGNGNVRVYGTIAPVSDYAVQRQTSLIRTRPMMTETPSTNYKGINVWAEGFEVRSLGQSGTSHSGGSVQTVKGVTSWSEGYGVVTASGGSGLPVLGVNKLATEYRQTVASPGSWSKDNGHGVLTWSPGYELQISSYHKGVVCWSPGFEVRINTDVPIGRTLSGVWSTPGRADELHAMPGRLLPAQQYAQAVVAPQPLTASALLLPDLRSRAAASPNWDEWYKCIGQAIYSRWINAEVCPGVAKLRVTADSNGKISAHVVDFVPAPDVLRDLKSETLFRESAVTAVNQVMSYEVPGFPSGAPGSVTFDIDMKRQVQGNSGVTLAKDASQSK